MESKTCQAVSEINNHGVELINAGKLFEAEEQLRFALSQVKIVLGIYEEHHFQNSENRVIHPLPKWDNMQNLTNSVCGGDNDDQGCDGKSADPQHRQYLFTKPIRITSTAFSSDALEDGKICSSIILYNLALIFHLEGSSKPSDDQYDLVRARSLYQHSYRLLLDTIYLCNDGCTGNAVVDLLCMAILNNLAYLCLHHMLDYSSSEVIFGRLLHFAHTIETSEYHNERVKLFMERQVSSFVVNATIRGTSLAVAAAAA